MSENQPHQTYQVLARKYRPATFEDMIGQDAMVTTLSNAFRTGRIAHAFMLTGVRGIGKTTTARLLARALNYETDTVDGPSVDLATPGRHCDAIMSSSHMDVLEMDAASRTGVDNMRELLDGVRYAPADARYKVYIIDEVHMLSAGAFNALLKTLEEPPDHAKFIFATTEIRKVPITVLSRCQRFDLRRVEADILAAHLKSISDQEGIAVSHDGLALIARAAEGSVRDGLSLLDQAIVQSGLSGDEVSAEQVRAMLGLADRVRLIDLFEHAMGGDAKASLLAMRAQYDDGAAPDVVMGDLLDICHEVSRAQTLGQDAAFDFAPDQIERLRGLGQTFTAGQLTRAWQILMGAHSEVRRAPVPLAAAEMALLKLALAGQMPPPELAAQIILQAQKLDSEGKTGLPQLTPSAAPQAHVPSVPSISPPASSASQTVSMTAPKPVAPTAPKMRLDSFADYVEQVDDLRLRHDLERYVSVVDFADGQAEIHITEARHNSIVGRMVRSLQELTGQQWLVSPVPTLGEPTLSDQRKSAKAKQDADDRSHPAFRHPLLKGAKILEIKDRAPNVIAGNFKKDDMS
ncbi:DNA polymerase III subunit gamma/tau [Algimonas arctica]|uniref:DNA polymerase III subunit gamma/tau n=1 Tax=Algimonas arctica TaxID=1479486 RepID=A0A8J3G2W1_9PROT|nr:DNA polymerase III subunit gamma/tau [Algimonas arctica]GHA97028.1 DNA polymerase III subunit gamma/tau [Algimonas arctica]